MVIANDNTVASGSWWPQTPEKIQRAQEMALRLRLPVIYLVDCSGLYLPEQSRSFPGRTGAGHIFKKNSELSAAGVPQIAGVFGDCIAGGGYMPIISDRVYMTEQAYMVIAGAALIKGAKSLHLSSLDIGGPEVHVSPIGLRRRARARRRDRARCASARDREPPEHRRLDLLPLRSRQPAPPHFPAESSSEAMVPADHRMTYAAEEVLARLVDASLFWEVLPDRGREMIVGVGRVGGLYMGFVANRQGLVDDPEKRGEKKPAGILYREGIAKMARRSAARATTTAFRSSGCRTSRASTSASRPSGWDLLGYGSSLIYTNSTNTTPMFTVLLRKASGAGYYAMAGLPYEPVVQLSTPMTRLRASWRAAPWPSRPTTRSSTTTSRS